MNRQEVEKLAEAGVFRGEILNGELLETHSSWIILSGKNALKIKKPVKYSFLDFSTLEYRKEACLRELSLNQRFSDIYLSVIPISLIDGHWELDRSGGAVVDYAVWMKRMAAHKQMDRLLERKKVKPQDILALARTVGSFHQKAEVVKEPFDLETSEQTFRDLLSIELFVSENLGREYQKVLLRSTEWNTAFLSRYAKRMQERIEDGFKRDVHGDLHSGNIFLYRRPVLFDCVEFNDHFRQIDILDEVAFLCMDMESFGELRLIEYFLAEYFQIIPCMPKEEDLVIFTYFKCLRANIRAKVHALSAQQATDLKIRNHHLIKIKKYLGLIDTYIRI